MIVTELNRALAHVGVVSRDGGWAEGATTGGWQDKSLCPGSRKPLTRLGFSGAYRSALGIPSAIFQQFQRIAMHTRGIARFGGRW